MKIINIQISKLNIPYRKALRISIGKITRAENVVVKITTDTGLVGWGESSPCAFITGGTQHTSYHTAHQLGHLIKGKDPLAIESRMQEIDSFIIGESSVKSAFDMALYDIAAKAAEMPLYQFLGGSLRELRTDVTIGLYDSVEQTIMRAQNILTQGFDALKIKVGRQGLADVAHVKAVRELAGQNVAIKIDSNQGWDYPTAVANINAMKSFNLQYSEQPLAAWDYDNLARLRDKVDLPICADESVFNHHDALRLINQGAADYLNIKLGKSGGIGTALKISAIAEAAGSKCMIGCFGESRLSLSVAAHLATARSNIYFLDLDSALNFKVDPVLGGITYEEEEGGLIHLPEAVGHGSAFDESFLVAVQDI